MSRYGFLSVLEEEMEKHFPYDFAINWDKKNYAVEVSFVLEAQNRLGVEVLDADDQLVADDVALEEFVLFYNPDKSQFNAEDYLVSIPYDPKKGFSRSFLSYFATQLADVADKGLSDLMDFLENPKAQAFSLTWDKDTFEKGLTSRGSGEMFPYPRY